MIQEHPCPLQQGCSSPAILGDTAQAQGGRSWLSLRILCQQQGWCCPRSGCQHHVPSPKTEEAPIPPIPPFHPCGTASPWKPTALRLPPGNQRGDTFRNIIFTDDKWWRLGADKGDEPSAEHRLFSQWLVFLLLFLLRARAAGALPGVLKCGQGERQMQDEKMRGAIFFTQIRIGGY